LDVDLVLDLVLVPVLDLVLDREPARVATVQVEVEV
jgi:hypothetical protein